MNHRRRVAMAGLFCVLGAHAAVRGQPCEGPVFPGQVAFWESRGTAYSPASYHAADLNGDGVLDLMAPGVGPGVVVLGRPDGRLGAVLSSDESVYGVSIALADFDGDGHLDVGAAGAQLSLWNGHGDATFDLVQTLPMPRAVAFIVAGDFNGDGVPDLAAAIHGDVFEDGDVVAVYLNDGAGVFAPHELYDTGLNPSTLIAGDFDGDGDDDLAVAHRSERAIWIFESGDDGRLGLPVVLDAAPNARAIRAADLDRDGAIDLVVAHDWADTLGVAMGIGDGTFDAVRYIDPDDRFLNVEIGDADSDGIADLYAISQFNQAVIVMRGLGDGTFIEAERWDVASPAAVIPADLDGNGREDVALVRLPMVEARLRGNDGASLPAQTQFGIGRQPVDLAAADFDGDGNLDIATANTGVVSGNVTILPGRGDGTFDPVRVVAAWGRHYRINAVDLDLDGALDIVSATSSPDVTETWIILGNGDGTFQTQRILESVRHRLLDASKDLTGDGFPDLAHLDLATSELVVLPGLGDGTFDEPLISPLDGMQGPAGFHDMDGDGVRDLVLAGDYPSDNYDVHVFPGRGDGTFAPSVRTALTPRSTSITIDDLDGDGVPDVVVGHRFDDGLSVLMGLGDGSLAPPRFLPGSGGRVRVADADGDGVPDILVADDTWSTLSLFRGLGGGDFATSEIYAGGARVGSLLALDLDEDGRLDVVTANSEGGTISVLGNQCSAASCRADLDGDGALTIFDFLAFGNLFDLADPRADFDGDGEFTIFDFLAFQNAFDAGCA